MYFTILTNIFITLLAAFIFVMFKIIFGSAFFPRVHLDWMGSQWVSAYGSGWSEQWNTYCLTPTLFSPLRVYQVPKAARYARTAFNNYVLLFNTKHVLIEQKCKQVVCQTLTKDILFPDVHQQWFSSSYWFCIWVVPAPTESREPTLYPRVSSITSPRNLPQQSRHNKAWEKSWPPQRVFKKSL